jgi:Holliday junction resolvase RusA-like endonuclease
MIALVYGRAATMGSKKGFVVGGRAIVVDDNPEKLRSFQAERRAAMRETKPDEIHVGSIALTMIVWLKRPKGHFGSGKNASVLKGSAPKHPTTKPDLSKVLRAVEDCGSGIWFRDDAQIVSARIEKRFAGENEEERVFVSAKVLEEK